MPKYFDATVRHHIIEIVAAHGFEVQLKPNGDDQYVKNLMFFSQSLNQTIYIRKDRGVGQGRTPSYFHIAVHPAFFNENWLLSIQGLTTLINRQTKKNLHSSSNYKVFPFFPEHDEPCGKSIKATNYGAMNILFQRMANSSELDSWSEADAIANKTNLISGNQIAAVVSENEMPTKGLIIKSPFIEKILSGRKTWEMRSSATQIRGPIALIKKAVVRLLALPILWMLRVR